MPILLSKNKSLTAAFLIKFEKQKSKYQYLKQDEV